MLQQTIDSSICNYGCSDNGSNKAGHDEQLPPVNNTASPEGHNENGLAGNSPLPVDKGQAAEALKATGTKRPLAVDSPVLQLHQLPHYGAANANLVYVRRKTEAEVCKSARSDETSMNFDCLSSGQLGNHEETTVHPKAEMIEPKVSCSPAFAPMAAASFLDASGKEASLVLSLGQPDTRSLSPELKYHHVPPSGRLFNGLKGIKHPSWQERRHHLQNLLNKLDEYDQGDYVQMLRSLSSVELSRHAVQLETRSIQLSLEEAREVHRVGVLNVLGRAIKAPAVRQRTSGRSSDDSALDHLLRIHAAGSQDRV